jgi:hypothetical protein
MAKFKIKQIKPTPSLLSALFSSFNSFLGDTLATGFEIPELVDGRDNNSSDVEGSSPFFEDELAIEFISETLGRQIFGSEIKNVQKP